MNSQPNGSTPALTFAGRLLILATFLVGGGVFYACLHFAYFDSDGQRFPLVMLLIPVLIAAGVFFGLTALILRMIGIRIWRV